MLGKNCYEGGNKHKYIPRYTEKQIGELDEIECRGMGISEIRKLFIIKEYLFDICEWCGDIKNANRT